MDQPSLVRARLGERIPNLGSDADTMFTTAEILDLIATYGGVEGAVVEGWRRKAAEYANLVDTTEGTSKRAMSNLHAQALTELNRLLEEQKQSAGVDRVRIHRISRESQR